MNTLMKLSDLTSEQLDKLFSYRYDWIVEKHEGPWDWEGMLKYQNPDFLVIEGYDVLLPLDKKHHPNISILRCIVSKNEDVLTIFLKDTTYYSGIDTGFLAVCERVPGEPWFLTTVYHEWYLTDYRRLGTA